MASKPGQSIQVDLKPIKHLLELILKSCQPRAIWLFGSRAEGNAQPESDWELLVVLSDKVRFEDEDKVVDASKLRRASSVDADIILGRESDFLAALRAQYIGL